jgi:iron complex outermembrane receptor protein
VAHTYELGLRGRLAGADPAAGVLSWDVGGFRTDLQNDIYAISDSLSTGFFQNVGSTRRQGGQADFNFRWDRGLLYLNYSYVDATFQSAFVLNSPSNPFQDENGNIQVVPGDHLPGIPKNRIKAGADYELLPGWSFGGTLIYVGSQFYKGDESNQNAPLPGYAVLGLHTSYRFWKQSEVYLTVQNVTDKQYATFGIFSDPTGVGAPGIPADADSNDPRVDNRFQSPGAPRSVFGGVRIRF